MRPLFMDGVLWLDFVNTELVVSGHPVDLIRTPAELGNWLTAAGVSSSGEHDIKSERLLTRARHLPEHVRRLADCAATGKAAPSRTLERLNSILSTELGYQRLVRKGNGNYLNWVPVQTAHKVLLPIAESAAHFLAGQDVSLVLRCANATCVLSFYDVTRNHGRSFCSPSTCGNRLRVAAFYQRLPTGRA